MPSLRSSPWIRGAPHSVFTMLISRISRRISSGTVGRPPRGRDFQRQYDLNPARCRRYRTWRPGGDSWREKPAHWDGYPPLAAERLEPSFLYHTVAIFRLVEIL